MGSQARAVEHFKSEGYQTRGFDEWWIDLTDDVVTYRPKLWRFNEDKQELQVVELVAANQRGGRLHRMVDFWFDVDTESMSLQATLHDPLTKGETILSDEMLCALWYKVRPDGKTMTVKTIDKWFDLIEQINTATPQT